MLGVYFYENSMVAPLECNFEDFDVLFVPLSELNRSVYCL
jgi:hypothetical protein